MTAPTDIYHRDTGVTLSDRDEKAQRSVKAFRALQPALTSYARVLTKNNRIRVELAARDNGSTDGVRIFFRPPIALGDNTPHQRRLCDKRDENKQLLCPACLVREDVLCTIYHEIAHICFDSFALPEDSDIQAAIEEAIASNPKKYAAKIREKIEATPTYHRDSYMKLAHLASPYLPILWNALEDARVNRELFKARKGTKLMFEGNEYRIFAKGVEQVDRYTREVKVVLWKDYPLNSQILVGLFCKATGYDYSSWFAPSVVEALSDPELTRLMFQLNTVRNAKGSFTLAFPTLVRLRELGFCKTDTDPEDEEETPEPDQEDTDGDSDDSADDDGAGGGNPENDSDDVAGDDAGGPSDASSGGGPGDGDSEAEGTPESSDDEGSSGSDSVDSGGHSDESGDSDSRSGGGSSEADSDSEPDGDEDDADGGAEAAAGDEDRDGDSGEDRSGSGMADDAADDSGEADAERAGDDSAGDGKLGDEPSGQPSESGAPSGEEPDSSDDESPVQGDDVDDSTGDSGGSGVPSFGSDSDRGEGSPGEEDEPGDDDSTVGVEGDPGEGDEPEPAEGDEPAPSVGDESDDLIDTGADKGEGGTMVEGEPDYGTAEDAAGALKIFGDHDDPPKTLRQKRDENADQRAVDKAIFQGMYFETPSVNLVGVREHYFDAPIMHEGKNLSEAWDADHYRSYGYSGYALGVEGDFDAPESILGPALLRMRVAFADNMRGDNLRHRKSGRVDGRVLGKRAHLGDERLFKKKVLPGKRDYFVILGLDISGSTVGRNIALIKAAAMAQATLLQRMGISFAIYAHTGSYSHRGSGLELDMYHIKDADEPWDTKTQERLKKISPSSANLDGHSIEYYRKRLDERTETDRIILYYSDGKMPAENHDEELEILQREIRVCKQKRYTLLGVGVRTDSPRRHGLDTVQIDELSEVGNVVKHLEKRLMA